MTALDDKSVQRSFRCSFPIFVDEHYRCAERLVKNCAPPGLGQITPRVVVGSREGRKRRTQRTQLAAAPRAGRTAARRNQRVRSVAASGRTLRVIEALDVRSTAAPRKQDQRAGSVSDGQATSRRRSHSLMDLLSVRSGLFSRGRGRTWLVRR